MKPSVLNSRAGDAMELAKPVIGTSVPAPPIFASLSYSPRPVKTAPRKTSVIEVAAAAASLSRLKDLKDI